MAIITKSEIANLVVVVRGKNDVKGVNENNLKSYRKKIFDAISLVMQSILEKQIDHNINNIIIDLIVSPEYRIISVEDEPQENQLTVMILMISDDIKEVVQKNECEISSFISDKLSGTGNTIQIEFYYDVFAGSIFYKC